MKLIILIIISLFLFACNEDQNTIPELQIQKSSIQFSIFALGELEAIKSTPITAGSGSQRSQTIAWVIDQYTRVKKGDIIIRFDGVPFQLEVDAAQYEINKLLLTQSEKQRELNISEDDFSNEEQVVNFEYLMAQKFNIDNPLLYTKIEMIDASNNEGFLQSKTQYLKVMGDFYQEKSQSEIGLIKSQSSLQQSKVMINQENLDSLEVRAPHDGIVVLQKDWSGALPQAGKSVFQGSKLASLPDLSQMQAKIYVPEIEAIGIKIDQKVKIKLHAFPNTDFNGVITQISKTAQPKKRNNPIKYFIVTVVINEKDTQRLFPGQRLDATLLTSEASESIAVPIQTIFREGSESWVYLKTAKNTFEKNPIKTSQCSSSQCIVSSGLSENDIISLINPQLNTEALN